MAHRRTLMDAGGTTWSKKRRAGAARGRGASPRTSRSRGRSSSRLWLPGATREAAAWSSRDAPATCVPGPLPTRLRVGRRGPADWAIGHGR